MRKNLTKIVFILAFVAISLYYLWPTVSLYLQQNAISDMPEAQQITYKEKHAGKMKSLRENSLSLGLDLQGGMHVTLQLATPQLIKELAGKRKDSTLTNLISESNRQAKKTNGDFINIFIQKFEKQSPNAKLSRYFRSDSKEITRRSTNEEIKTYLQGEQKEAVGRALQIIRERINRFGVASPAIERLGSNRITVALPGVADKDRVKHLLKGTARLEFRLGADPNQLASSRKKIIQFYNHYSPNDSTADSLAQAQAAGNPLLQIMSYYKNQRRGRIVFGFAATHDTSMVDSLLHNPKAQKLLPRNTSLMWGAKPVRKTENGEGIFELIGVRNRIELTGKVITDASVNFNPQTNIPKVSMSMNSEGARKWARLTGANIGKPVAIILDGYVYSYPNVQTKISGGSSEITGMSGVKEAKDLVNILLSGALPAPLNIIGQHTVGPSLGEASIQAGFRSIIAAFIVVILFMIAYYLRMGAVADVAVLFCLLFIMGILAAFHATLTLPGIAGIVLTIGIAVDANVLINDRIRRELARGKSFHAAIDTGYKQSWSAILDGHVTTFITAAILYGFGTGPIKGFGITLMAGVVASLFSAVVITRVIVDYMTRDKTKTFNLG